MNLKNSIHRQYLLVKSVDVPIFLDWTPALTKSQLHACSGIPRECFTPNNDSYSICIRDNCNSLKSIFQSSWFFRDSLVSSFFIITIIALSLYLCYCYLNLIFIFLHFSSKWGGGLLRQIFNYCLYWMYLSSALN